jgi:hypothetical protein
MTGSGKPPDLTVVGHGRARPSSASRPPSPRPRVAYQFLIVLSGTQEPVWRRILVPERYTFWDLHVAIQDAMGWTDHHLHEFEVASPDPGAAPLRIGIPDPDFAEPTALLAGWEIQIKSVFGSISKVARYHYDFGDDWIHAVVHEGYERQKPRQRLPVCVAASARRADR